MTTASTATPSASRGTLDRMGSAWTNFWFTPSDAIGLSLLRILVGVVALWWYLGFAWDLTDWFGSTGLFKPDKYSLTRAGGEAAWSILEFATTPEAVKFFYGLGFLAIIGMIVGLFTRVSTIATLIWVLSFVHGSSAMARPVDDILAMLVFYLCIAPAGAYCSLDAWFRQRKGRGIAQRERIYSSANLATRLIQVHLAIIYAATAISQLQWDAWWQGSAVWWMMARPESRLIDFTPLSSMGRTFVYLVNFLTLFIVLYEICFAALIWNRAIRPILLWISVPFWLGLMLVSGMPSFCLLMLVANLAFVSPETLHRWCACCPGMKRQSPATV